MGSEASSLPTSCSSTLITTEERTVRLIYSDYHTIVRYAGAEMTIRSNSASWSRTFEAAKSPTNCRQNVVNIAFVCGAAQLNNLNKSPWVCNTRCTHALSISARNKFCVFHRHQVYTSILTINAETATAGTGSKRSGEWLLRRTPPIFRRQQLYSRIRLSLELAFVVFFTCGLYHTDVRL